MKNPNETYQRIASALQNFLKARTALDGLDSTGIPEKPSMPDYIDGLSGMNAYAQAAKEHALVAAEWDKQRVRVIADYNGARNSLIQAIPYELRGTLIKVYLPDGEYGVLKAWASSAEIGHSVTVREWDHIIFTDEQENEAQDE